MLRIAGGLATLLYVLELIGFALPPESLRFPPEGTSWIRLPVSQAMFNGTLVIASIAGALVILGWRPAWTATAALLAIFYSGWVTTLTAKVDHHHHVLWVLLIIAVSPTANTWSIRREDRDGSYDWPMVAVVVLLGLIYFGAGLQKLGSGGFGWAWSDNLTNIMLNLAWGQGKPTQGWMVEYPTISKVLASGGLAFELTFLPMILFRRVRLWVWPLGLIFHFATWLVLGIGFLTLMILYVAFIPVDQATPPSAFQGLVIALLVAFVAAFSIAGEDEAWPVAAYPGFEGYRGVIDREWRGLSAEIDGEEIWVVDTPQAHSIRPQRMRKLVTAAMDAGKVGALAGWLDADVLVETRVDSWTGEVLTRNVVFDRTRESSATRSRKI